MKILLITILSLGLIQHINGQDIVGKWKTIDDNSGDARSVVEIYKKGNEYFGRILKTFPKPDEDPDPICDLCPSDRKGKKIIGMEIIRKMVKDGEEFSEGEILDPENGKTYRCKLWIEDGVLNVRGYVAFFYRTQLWYKYSGE